LHAFQTTHPELSGFDAYYAAEILPQLDAGEGTRLDALTKLKWCVAGLVALAVIGMAVAFYQQAKPIAYIMIASVPFAIAMVLKTYLFRDIKASVKSIIVRGVCAFLGWNYSSKMDPPDHMGTFKDLGLLTRNYDRFSVEDHIQATAHGANFVLHEAHLEERRQTKNGERWDTIFRGQLLVIDFDKSFLGKTVVLRDKGMFNRKAKGEMKRVGLVDPIFEKIFEAYGTDQVEARYLLTPDFMQRLVDLEESVDGRKIRFGFVDKQLLIAVETSNRYEAGSMLKPLAAATRMQTILDEIGAIYDVIDGVLKPLPRGA
jgi:hypothetical protein